MSVEITKPMAATPTISATRPARTIVTGASRPLMAPAKPLATKEPIARASRMSPVCSARQPEHELQPEREREDDAELAERDDQRRDVAVAERRDAEERERRAGRATGRVRRAGPTTRSAAAPTAAIANATGMGEMSHVHVQSPMLGVDSLNHQP